MFKRHHHFRSPRNFLAPITLLLLTACSEDASESNTDTSTATNTATNTNTNTESATATNTSTDTNTATMTQTTGGTPGAGGTGGAGTGGTSSGGTNSGGTSSGGTNSGGTSSGGTAGSTGGVTGCTGPVPGTTSSNPLIPEIFTADPAVLVHDCTFYITAGHDEGTTGFRLLNWYVLSSTDLVNWSYNGGPAMDLNVFSWSNANAWASHMVERNGKFYWYVPIAENHGPMAIGVAVADSPLGPFQDAIGGPLVDDDIEMAAFGYTDAGQTVYTIDPAVFIDDDGQAYLYYGGFGRMVIAPLASDMVSFSGDMVERTPQGFFEAPYMAKRENLYYMVYAAGQNPATIDYMVADHPMGPWRNRARILEALPGNIGEDAPTSHPAIAEFLGEWYLVYHISNGDGGGTYRRQVAMERLTFNQDGTIQPITPSSGISF